MTTLIAIKSLDDPIIDTLGYDPRDNYCEEFWLPLLGPTAFLLLRMFANSFDETPEGFHLDLSQTCQKVGLGIKTGTHSPIRKSLNRFCRFGIGRHDGGACYYIRRTLPPLNNRHIKLMPDFLINKHNNWLKENDEYTPATRSRRRAKSIAEKELDKIYGNLRPVQYDDIIIGEIEKKLIDRGFTSTTTNEIIKKYKDAK